MKYFLITLGIFGLALVIYLLRRLFMFFIGLFLLLGGSAGAIVGFLWILVEEYYLTGSVLLFFAALVAFFGWELVVKSNEMPPPEHTSKYGSSYDPAQGAQPTGKNVYDRHGSSFGSGF